MVIMPGSVGDEGKSGVSEIKQKKEFLETSEVGENVDDSSRADTTLEVSPLERLSYVNRFKCPPGHNFPCCNLTPRHFLTPLPAQQNNKNRPDGPTTVHSPRLPASEALSSRSTRTSTQTTSAWSSTG